MASNVKRPALQSKDVNSRSRLPQPSKLKPPMSTMKRTRKSSDDEAPAKKLKTAPVPSVRQPVSRPTVGRTGVTARTARAPVVKRPAGSKVAAKPVVNKVNAATKKPAAPAKKKGRPAWDIKGRLEDTEAALADRTKLLGSLEERFNAYVNENSQLKGEIQTTAAEKTRVATAVSDLEKKLAQQEDEFQSARRSLKREIEDKDEAVRTLKRREERLESELTSLRQDLTASQQECGGLKTSIAQMTAAQAGIKAELSSTQHQLSAANDVIEVRDTTIVGLEDLVTQLKAAIDERDAKIRDAEDIRRKLHNTIQELKGNIRVFCRVRPLISKEIESGDNMHHIHFPDSENKMVEIENLKDSSALNESMRTGNRKFQFSFDQVFNPESSQTDVFQEISQLVQSALDGYNVCIFAYGQTGSGKTFTMEGPETKCEESVGMIPRSVQQIFITAQHLQSKGWEYDMEASFLEIYNETIRDLLGAAHSKLKHDIRMIDNKSKEVEVTNVNVVKVTSPEQVHKLLEKATQNRAVAATNYNERSSRSHSVFRLKLTGRNTITDQTCQGTLNLVDLAGSERLPQEGYEGDRLKEMKNINKSLSTLGQVILALGNKDNHIPYRNSKLTHLLQDSLGGNSKTLMFVNISPKEENFQETLCSLRFAVKVNECNIGTAQQKRAK